MVGNMVQTYIVSIMAITIMCYFSPLLLPMVLFEQTKAYSKTVFSTIIKYASYPPILFISMATSMLMIDMLLFGTKASYITQNMFNADGTVNGSDCWANNIWNAPPMCTLAKLSSHIETYTVLGNKFYRLDDYGVQTVLPAMLLGFLIAIVFLSGLKSLMDKFETIFKSVISVADFNAQLEGSIMNDKNNISKMIPIREMTKQATVGTASALFKGKGGKGGISKMK
jgi:hypothetical protein